MLKTIPPGLQVVIFLFLTYFFATLGDLVYHLSLSFVVGQEELLTMNWKDSRYILSRNLFFQIFSFVIAFMVMLRLTQQPLNDLLYIKKTALKPILFTIAVFILGMIGMQLLSAVNEPLRYILPAGALEHEITSNALNQKIVYQTNPIQFIFTLIIMAGLPAFCEELVFRGYLLKKMTESGMSDIGAILVSAGIFSLTHFQPLKFLPIFFLGACLGYIYIRFKNIKYPMLLHFLINGSQITYGYIVSLQLF